MRFIKAVIGSILIAFLMGSPAMAERLPKGGKSDSRIRTVVYKSDDVVRINATYGISLLISFGNDELIDTITLGDTVAWQVVPNKKRSLVFIKPVSKEAITNMNIVTNKRIYTFSLTSSASNKKRDQIYQVRFRYPEEAIDAKLLAQARENVKAPNLSNLDVANTNTDYAYKGSKTLKPSVIFDDGVKTFIKFKGRIPAIYQVDGKSNETLVNARRENEYMVVDGTNRQWVFRRGSEVICVYNLQADRQDSYPSADSISQPVELKKVPFPFLRPRLGERGSLEVE